MIDPEMLATLDINELRDLLNNLVMQYSMQLSVMHAHTKAIEQENEKLKELLGGQLLGVVLRTNPVSARVIRDDPAPTDEPETVQFVDTKKGFQA